MVTTISITAERVSSRIDQADWKSPTPMKGISSNT